MAQMLQDSDSDSDDYEFMKPISAVKHRKEGLYSNEAEIEEESESLQASLTISECYYVWSKNKDEVKIKKPKNQFTQHFLGESLKDKAFRSGQQHCSVILSDTNTSSLTPSAGTVMQSSPILTFNAPPKIEPKPSRKLTEEEKLEQKRQKQKRVVAAARRNRSFHSWTYYKPEYLIDLSYGKLEINNIVSQYIDHLPLEVVVSKGIYGKDERYSFSTSDKCIIHCVKKRDLVRIQDPQTNNEFSVPLSSAIKFALVYDPNNDEEHARKGFHFPLVSDVLDMKQIPKMGLAHLADSDIEGLKSTELIVIKEVIFPANALNPRKLCVYSLTAKCRKELLENDEIDMNTCPNLIQAYLLDIMHHVPNPSSLHVAMFRDPLIRPLVAPGISATMFQRPLFLKKRFTDVLLIATGSSEGATGDDNTQPFEIPTDIDVEFEVIKHTKEERDKLLEQSRKLREGLKAKDIQHHSQSSHRYKKRATQFTN